MVVASIASVEASANGRVDEARRVALNAYAPYSGFHVGCVVETDDGRTFHGVNMENASYGLGMCAEVGALTAAAAAGALSRVVRISVAGGQLSGGVLQGTAMATPCGRCRQLIFETARLGQRDIAVLCGNGDGHMVQTTISELLPAAFGPDTLTA